MKSHQFFALSALALAASLSACGGGGGNDTTVAAGGSAVVNVPASGSTLIGTVSPASYGSTSEELLAFNRLNTERNACGYGLLAQSAQLDAAARAHNDYQIINNINSHLENQQQFPFGYTGTRPAERVAVQGYTNFVGVGDSFTALNGTVNKSGIGEVGMRNLLSAPYHLSALVDGYRDVGISARASNETTPVGVNQRVILQVNTGYKLDTGKQLIAATDVNSYPCEGSIGINRQLSNESPDPVPGRDLFLSPVGTAIYISVRDGQQLVISTASVTEVATGAAVVLRTPVTSANDPNALYAKHEGYIAPDTPLKAATLYAVRVTGSNNGSAFTKAFNFTTGK